MKHIFDWLRERSNDTNGVDLFGDKFTNMNRVNAIINEAEAKWGGHAICYLDSPCEYQNEDIRIVDDETDCCEWKFNEFEEQWETSCGVLLNPNSNDREATFYCCHCGKPIKISEVE